MQPGTSGMPLKEHIVRRRLARQRSEARRKRSPPGRHMPPPEQEAA
jgi:hypothetical protein